MRDDNAFIQKFPIPISAAAARQIVIKKREDKRREINEQVSQIIQMLIDNDYPGDDDNLAILRLDTSTVKYWPQVHLELRQLGYTFGNFHGNTLYIFLPKK